jgi:hypothetical protein
MARLMSVSTVGAECGMIPQSIPLSVKVFFACSVVLVMVSGHTALEIWQNMDLVGIHDYGQVPSDQIPDTENVWFWRMIFNGGAVLISAINFLREMGQSTR